jgi:hypothetical protein
MVLATEMVDQFMRTRRYPYLGTLGSIGGAVPSEGIYYRVAKTQLHE